MLTKKLVGAKEKVNKPLEYCRSYEINSILNPSFTIIGLICDKRLCVSVVVALIPSFSCSFTIKIFICKKFVTNRITNLFYMGLQRTVFSSDIRLTVCVYFDSPISRVFNSCNVVLFS